MQDISSLKYIPQELKFNGLWCGWRKTERGKEPFDLRTDTHARSNDPTTFCGYATLLQNIHKYLLDDSKSSGIGLGIFRGYSAIDIDNCIDENGNVSEMANDIITFCSSYTEYSPSKKGIRIIFKTNVKINKEIYYINNQSIGLEIYISNDTHKYVTITGNRFSDEYHSINKINITYILDKYMKKGGFNLNKALKKDNKLNTLWNKLAPGSNADESESDMALACKLAYYLKNDESEIKKYFEMSPYYKSKDDKHKKKWRRGYGKNTVKGAVQFITPVTNLRTITPRKSYNLNDTGNAHRFVEKFGADIRYNVDNKAWMLWNGKYWQYDIKNNIKNYVEVLAEEMVLDSYNEPDTNTKVRILKNIDNIYSASGKNNLLREAEHISGIPVTNCELDNDGWLLNCDNGDYNLRTGEMLPHDRSRLVSQTVGGEIDFSKPPTRFLQFLDEMFEGKEEVIHYVHKSLGYSASNSMREQCMWILESDGNSGKSLLLEIISQALGSYAITSRPQLLIEQPHGNSNLEEIARLKGKRFIMVEEIQSGDKLNESLVKSLTSGIGNQVARFLYGNSFEFTVTGKIWMATNYEPTVRGTDKGVWRRIKKIHLDVDFTGREDKDLKSKLEEELPQIRAWLVKGCELYLKEGLKEPKEILESTKDYKEQNDIVQIWINERCELKPSYYTQASVLFKDFNAYSRENKFFEINSNQFGRNMGKKFKRKNYSGKNFYMGIRTKEGVEDISKKVAFDNIKVGEDI